MRYMLLFQGLAAAPEATDERTADHNRQWGEWIAALDARGELIAGSPFQWHGRVVTADEVSDLQLGQVDIGGFVLIEVNSYEQAIGIAKQAPHIALGGTTIVRELISFGAT